jgi:hypothetical protein
MVSYTDGNFLSTSVLDNFEYSEPKKVVALKKSNQVFDPEKAEVVYSRIRKILKTSPVGGRHAARLRAGKLAGGYMEADNLINEAEMLAMLRTVSDEISDGGVTSDSEWQTILDGIEEGKKTPITNYNHLQQWQFDIDDTVEELNKTHAVVRFNSKTLIMKITYKNDLERGSIITYDYLPSNSFILAYVNRKLQIGVNNDGSPKMKSIGEIWLKHENRRQYLDGVILEPSTYVNGVEIKSIVPNDVFNLWNGYPIIPSEGDCPLILRHIHEVICSSNDEYSNYLLNWIAKCFQYPNLNGQVAVVLNGQKGTGKSLLGNFMASMLIARQK